MRRSVGLLSLLATTALAGCFTATDTVTGEDSLLADPCAPGGPNSGSRWQDLYACYFGPSGQASCGSRSGCHGDQNQAGAVGSGGYVCGAPADACRMGMIASNIVPMGGAPNATTTILYLALRKSDGTGINNMPKYSTFTFQESDLARIRDWIEHGALDN